MVALVDRGCDFGPGVRLDLGEKGGVEVAHTNRLGEACRQGDLEIEPPGEGILVRPTGVVELQCTEEGGVRRRESAKKEIRH